MFCCILLLHGPRRTFVVRQTLRSVSVEKKKVLPIIYTIKLIVILYLLNRLI